jgi:hypothetical protein
MTLTFRQHYNTGRKSIKAVEHTNLIDITQAHPPCAGGTPRSMKMRMDERESGRRKKEKGKRKKVKGKRKNRLYVATYHEE